MTLDGHFMSNFHYYELTLRFIIYLFTVESVYIRVTDGHVGSGVADRNPQNIWNLRKNCVSFVDATLIGTNYHIRPALVFSIT